MRIGTIEIFDPRGRAHILDLAGDRDSSKPLYRLQHPGVGRTPAMVKVAPVAGHGSREAPPRESTRPHPRWQPIHRSAKDDVDICEQRREVQSIPHRRPSDAGDGLDTKHSFHLEASISEPQSRASPSGISSSHKPPSFSPVFERKASSERAALLDVALPDCRFDIVLKENARSHVRHIRRGCEKVTDDGIVALCGDQGINLLLKPS